MEGSQPELPADAAPADAQPEVPAARPVIPREWSVYLSATIDAAVKQLVGARDRQTEVLARIARVLERAFPAFGSGSSRPGPSRNDPTPVGRVVEELVQERPRRPQGPPPDWTPGRSAPAPKGGQRKPRSSRRGGQGDREREPPGKVRSRIDDQLGNFQEMPLTAFPKSILREQPGAWVQRSELQGLTWGELLGDVYAQDYLLWRVRKQCEKESQGLKFPCALEWWNWRGEFHDDALKCLWLLQHRDRLIGEARAGGPADDEDYEPEPYE